MSDAREAPLLVLDTGSPTVSLAVGAGGEVLAEAQLELRRSSEELLGTVEDLLERADTSLQSLSGLLALAGPGSFTGLRIGLATALGFHQGLGLRAAAVPTLPVLALAADAPEGGRVIAAVDALRGDWMAQPFTIHGGAPVPAGEAELRPAETLDELGPGLLIGFGVEDIDPPPAGGLEVRAALPLAPVAVRHYGNPSTPAPAWDAATLIQPIYFRPPAVTRPKNR
jgi:tRNA threonylcarbamoyladenosine biosynthesis protein TsaB